jgi:Flp pilus assembly protein TadD
MGRTWVSDDAGQGLGTTLAKRSFTMSYLVKESRTPAVTAVERARRQSQRGDERRAMLILREACFAVEYDAALWVHYGLSCLRARRRDEGFRALSHALWLRERARDDARAQVMRDLIAHLSSGGTLPLTTREAA